MPAWAEATAQDQCLWPRLMPGWQPLRGAPEAPTEGAGLNRKLAAEPATAEAV